ncbi:hypothetical protein ERJ75_001230700 [Trypanosoma vivax]|uniref:Spermidine synthase n=1 Tax=Trypanosoma vivax (strain Y486) TaxID=1055687 RepID=G0U1E6_TRYVY|nr:hypothetical protein ERJ75_001230700 [Trypanosoma vivax]CCC49901.1 conserved hypothetical protein [Trypanosoma vivax Y486]
MTHSFRRIGVPGQRAERQYLNKLTAFFFREIDKGVASPYVVLCCGALLSLAGWKFSRRYLEANRQFNIASRKPYSRVPMSDVHNAFWGFHSGTTDNGLLVATGPRHVAETMTPELEEALKQPTLLYSEVSELADDASAARNGAGLSVACMELSEYDPQLGDDVVYRSLHYIRSGPPEDHDSVAHASSRSGTPAAHGSACKETSSSYFSRMPASGLSVIHGMVKCRSITSMNNCIPLAGHLETEYARKMMLALGPAHVLRDAAHSILPTRFIGVKEAPVSTLVCGLHSGEIPRWLSNAFPNFKVDVVERDGTLARICRQFMGFQESSNLNLFVSDPADFLRRNSVVESPQSSAKRYDLIMLDTMDGDGRMDTQYCRLDFINSIRNNLSPAGCVVAALPNRDAAFLYSAIQNWRLSFAGRTVLLVHCITSPHTMLITFQDDATRGRANFGTVGSVDEFKDLLRAMLSHYGPKRVPFDITSEVSLHNFAVIAPGKAYPIEAFLPAGHPQLLNNRSSAAAAGGQSFVSKWNTWLRRWSSTWLTPSQRADLRRLEK